MCTQAQAITILRQAARRCGALYGDRLREAYLYGSYARGEQHDESDVDILMTVEAAPVEIAARRADVARIASDLSLTHDVTVSLTVKPQEQFARFSEAMPYYRNVVQEGIRYDGQ